MRSKPFRFLLASLAAFTLSAAATTSATAAPPAKFKPKPPVATAPIAAPQTTTSTTPTNLPPNLGPPSTGQPFPTSTNASNFPAGRMTIRLMINSAATDGGWAKYTMYIANRTPRDKLFTKTGLATFLNGANADWSQTADNTGGFGFEDSGHWWIRSGTMRSGRVIKITGLVQMPDRKKFISGNPLRDATIVCIQAKVRATIIGQPEKTWPEAYSTIDRHSCAQYAAGS